MYKIKTVLFWIVTLIFVISDFIGLFINDRFEQNIRIFFRDKPLAVKIGLVLIVIIFLIWSFPYKKEFKRLFSKTSK